MIVAALARKLSLLDRRTTRPRAVVARSLRARGHDLPLSTPLFPLGPWDIPVRSSSRDDRR